jgi:hypothetical protein
MPSRMMATSAEQRYLAKFGRLPAEEERLAGRARGCWGLPPWRRTGEAAATRPPVPEAAIAEAAIVGMLVGRGTARDVRLLSKFRDR